MDGFDTALDGYYDVEDQMARYLRARADAHFEAGRAAPDTRAAFEARREAVRDHFRESIGGLPDRPADVSAETTGRLQGDGYSVELLAFESHPGFHVTANCYVPAGEGPFPGVLFLAGHVDSPKGGPDNQKACAELASNGVVVLVADPLGQGERTQYVDDGDPVFTGSGGVFPHCYAGQKCFYAGATLARYMVHDDRCALAYLAGRPDVDADRIGVTGTSGGGIRTMYLGLVDDRVDAAAPCCSVTTRREWLKTGKRVDAEQVVYGAIPRGIGYDDLLTAVAPAPVCVGAAASDQYFPIEGVHETVERARRIYDRYDAGSVELTVADATHCSVYEIGADVFSFLCDALEAGTYDPRSDHEVRDPSALHCTPAGSVLGAYPDERTVEDLIRAYVAGSYPDAGTAPPPKERGEGYPAALRRRLTEALDLDRDGCERHPRFVDRVEADGLTVQRVWFRTERDPDAVVAGVLVSDPDAPTTAPAVVLYENGTRELPGRSDDLASLAREHGAAFAFDPRGVGAVRNRSIPVPPWVEDYRGVYGTEFKLAYDALLLGTSLFGMRVADAREAAAFLRGETGADRVSFVGEETGAYHALYAAATTDDVARVDLRGMGPSFHALATAEDAPYRPRLTLYDALDGIDVPHALAALDGRGVRVTGVSSDDGASGVE